MDILATCLHLLSGFVYCPLTPPVQGYGSQYNLGPPGYDLMEATVELRQSWWPDSRLALPPDTTAWDGFVAGLSCDDIGKTYLIRVLPSKQWRPYLSADCAGDAHSFLWMRDNNILVEFGGREALKLGITGRPPGQVQIELVVLPANVRLSWPKPTPGSVKSFLCL